MRPFPLTPLIIGSTLAVIEAAQGAECIAWADGECIQVGLPNPRFEYPSLVGGPDLELVDQAVGYRDGGGIEVPLEEISPHVDAYNVSKLDVCALVQKIVNCDGACVELSDIEEPEIIDTVVETVDPLCKRYACAFKGCDSTGANPAHQGASPR